VQTSQTFHCIKFLYYASNDKHVMCH